MSQLHTQAAGDGTPTRPVAASVPRRKPSGVTRRTRESRTGWVLVAPFFIVMILFLALPLGYALWLSMFTESLAVGSKFSGLSNYKQTFTDPVFLAGVRRVVLFGIIQIPIMLGLALVGALALDAMTTRFSKLYRLIAFMPYAVPTVLGALMWGFLYSETFGPFAEIPTAWGGDAIKFFTGQMLLFSLGNIVTWTWTGYNMIVLYSALQGVPREMYEAAVVDGATPTQIAWRIKVPAIKPAIALASIFTVIGTMQFFTEPQILARFAPDIAAGFTPNLYAYNLAFTFSQFHYSAAISFTLALVVFVLSYAFVFSSRRKEARA